MYWLHPGNPDRPHTQWESRSGTVGLSTHSLGSENASHFYRLLQRHTFTVAVCLPFRHLSCSEDLVHCAEPPRL